MDYLNGLGYRIKGEIFYGNSIRHNLRLEARFCDQEMAFLLWNGHDWKHIYRSNRANLGFMPYQSA